MNPLLIASLVSALFAGAIGYGTASHFGQVKITEMELAHANERIAIQRAARSKLEGYQASVVAAQDEAARRVAVLQRDLDNSRKSSGGLRDASTAAVRASADSPTSCSHITNAYDVMVAESLDFIREVAEAADRCDIERQALMKAWPRVTVNSGHAPD